eukprot:GGOE01036438.1.p1 GENE.GGOE01036438.1~~GGOE01036438.1.p1  ORF type:complete len:341 (-),score=43.28 GGOE01036438.1:305-1204(-)
MQNFFTPYGAIESCKVVMDKAVGTSKGFGFVKFVSRKDAENCLLQAQGTQVDGKKLKIQKAEFGRGPPGNASLYVTGFDTATTTEADFQNLFGPYGNVVKVNMLTPQPGKKGVAFVVFEYFAEANLAVNALGQWCELGGQSLTVRLADQTMRAVQQFGKGGKGDGWGGKGWGARFSPYERPGKGKGGKGNWGKGSSWGDMDNSWSGMAAMGAMGAMGSGMTPGMAGMAGMTSTDNWAGVSAMGTMTAPMDNSWAAAWGGDAAAAAAAWAAWSTGAWTASQVAATPTEPAAPEAPAAGTV